MAVPENIMLSLDHFTGISSMDIRPLGRHNRLVYYSVFRKAGGSPPRLRFTVIADIEKEQIKVENLSNQLLFTCNGGLRGAEDMMSVYSALNYFRCPMLTVCGNKLLDQTENNPLMQLTLFKRTSDAFSIMFVDKKLQIPGSMVINILHLRRFSTIEMTFKNASPTMLTPLKKVLALIATVKVMYNHYSFHLHLMPSDIPYLMPPGTPKEPLSALESVREIVMRPSCSAERRKIIYGDLLDGQTLATLMVVEYVKGREPTIIEVLLKDPFGSLQLTAVSEITTGILQVFDSKKDEFGRYDGDPRTHKLFNKEVMFLKSDLPFQPDQQPGTKGYSFLLRDNLNTSLVAFLYSMKEWQVIKISMDPEIPVHWKAVILAHAAILSQLFLKFSSDRPKLFVKKLNYREVSK